MKCHRRRRWLKGKNPLAWADAKNEIIVALREGKIQASGIRVGTTVRAKINAPEWADLQFKLDSDQAMATNSLGIYEPQWEKLKFHREDILANWPEVEMQSAAPPLPDITEDELLSWVKRDTWTAGEAVLLLHGKVPCNPWLSDDELATRFVKSTVHLAVELHRGAIGERGLVNGQQQWIDTPSRWYEWVFGEIPVPHMVGSAFLEPRYAATPRLHYIHAKDVLLEKSQCSPEEIAMWLFANELIAWHGDEPESRRFVFQWSPGDDYDFVIRLTDIYFSAAQLEEFEPVERWMTYQQILDRWAASMTTTEAAELVLSRAGTSDLSAVHPLVGLPRADNEPTVEHCMFPLSRIEEVEASIGIESDRTASGLISAEKKMPRVA